MGGRRHPAGSSRPQPAIAEIRAPGVVAGRRVLDLPGAQAHELGPVPLAAQDDLHELAGEVPVGNLEPMGIDDLDRLAEVALEGGEAGLDERVGRRVAIGVAVA
jgi:hypothetical protein